MCWIISLNLPLNWILRWNSFCSAPIGAVAWSLSGEYVVSVDKSRRAVLWSDIWDQTWAPFFHLINWNHSWKCTQGCHQNTTLLGKAHTLHSVNSKTLSVVTVFVAKKPCHFKSTNRCANVTGVWRLSSGAVWVFVLKPCYKWITDAGRGGAFVGLPVAWLLTIIVSHLKIWDLLTYTRYFCLWDLKWKRETWTKWNQWVF